LVWPIVQQIAIIPRDGSRPTTGGGAVMELGAAPRDRGRVRRAVRQPFLQLGQQLRRLQAPQV